MSIFICPKCGFHQDEGKECRRCGIIFSRYREAAVPQRRTVEPESGGLQASSALGSLRRFYRILRWVILAGLILVIALILHPSPPPSIAVDAGALRSAETKVETFQKSVQQGQTGTLRMDESELNGWLGANLALKRKANALAPSPAQAGESAVSLAKKALAPSRSDESPAVENARSSVRDVRIELLEDSLRAYVVFDLHGMDLSLQLEGRLVVRDGYLRLEPTSGKLGSLPLLTGTLESTAYRLFDSPENKEKFRLPPHIRDMRIERGELTVSSR